MLLRVATRGAVLGLRTTPSMAPALALGVRRASTAVASQETVSQKIYRWMDICGVLTKYHSRRAWILDLDPPQRTSSVLVTEYERKLLVAMVALNFFFLPWSFWYWYGQFTHLATKPPVPLPPEMPYLNARKREFTWHGGQWNTCKECRWLEFECKKECFDKLNHYGKETWGLRGARTQTIGFH